MKKRVLLWVLAIFAGGELTAQQMGQFSQYQLNPYVFNPAAAGLEPHLDVTLAYRQQWVGIDNSPEAYYVSANTSLTKFKKPSYKPASIRISRPNRYSKYSKAGERKLRHAVGGFIGVDSKGPWEQNIGNLGYALHLPVTEKWTWSFGTSIGATQVSFDQGLVNTETDQDQVYAQFLGATTNQTVFDANFGTWFYNENFHIGYSTAQLLQNEISFGDVMTGSQRKLHHYITGGWHVFLTPDVTFYPNFLVKYLDPLPTSFDVNALFTYRKRAWAGVSYRQNDAIVGMAGFIINDLVKLGYAYDLTVNSLSTQSTGSHEIMIGLLINKSNRITF